MTTLRSFLRWTYPTQTLEIPAQKLEIQAQSVCEECWANVHPYNEASHSAWHDKLEAQVLARAIAEVKEWANGLG